MRISKNNIHHVHVARNCGEAYEYHVVLNSFPSEGHKGVRVYEYGAILKGKVPKSVFDFLDDAVLSDFREFGNGDFTNERWDRA